MKYTVSVMRRISVDVEVDATDADDAYNKVSSTSFELPPRDEWNGHKDWEYLVINPDGNETDDAA